MENTTGPKFINGPEAQQMLNDISGIDLSELQTISRFKVWPGICFGVYKNIPEASSPVLLDKIKLIHLGLEKQGPLARLTSLVTGSSYELSVYPTWIIEGELAMSFPQKTYIERTIQVFPSGGKRINLATALQAHHQCKPSFHVENVPFIDTWLEVKRRFVNEETFFNEVERLKRRVSLI